jgi:hypothetical protein
VDQLPGRDFRLDGIEEADELLVPVALHAAADDAAIQHVQRCERRRFHLNSGKEWSSLRVQFTLLGCTNMGGPIPALIVAWQGREINDSRAILVMFNLLAARAADHASPAAPA